MKHSSVAVVGIIGMVLASSACAESVSPPAPQKFFPLKAAYRSDAVQIKKSEPLRSDQAQLNGGFMRIDRGAGGLLSDTRANTPVVTRPDPPKPEDAPPVMKDSKAAQDDVITDRESEELEGNSETYNPVLSLFDSESTAPLRSFSEAMSVGSSLVSLTRHPVWPIPLRFSQYISSGYGMRDDPFTHRRVFHGGIDIVAAVGTPVVASADGTAIAVANDANYGRYIALQHVDGTVSRYGHLSAQSVAEGQAVHAGQVIGAVGATGRATGAHLDFRVSKNNVKHDPLTVLSIPRDVAMNSANTVPVVVPAASSRIASNALPKRPMVIQVR